MAALDNPRHEAFAQALAAGSSLREATRRAGLSTQHAPRMRRLKGSRAIETRVAEIARLARWGGAVELADLFDLQVGLARRAAPEERDAKADLSLAKELLAEASKTWERGPGARRAAGVGPGGRPARIEPPREAWALPPHLTKEEWLAAFAPKNAEPG
ncbi:MAG: hypothetical protein ACREEH_05660 [Caulobacteraceae bacterium]